MRQGELKAHHFQKVIRHINRKEWWHVPPIDPRAYEKRGKFLASSFIEAEFYGRPCDMPDKVSIAAPIVGDDRFIEMTLIGRVESDPDMSVSKRLALDAKLRRAAMRKGFDSIVLLTPKNFQALRRNGTVPRSIELNVLDLNCLRQAAGKVSRGRDSGIDHGASLCPDSSAKKTAHRIRGYRRIGPRRLR